MATSFINRECDETLLLDLKHLLKEAKQKIPPVLMTLNDPSEKFGTPSVSVALPLLLLCFLICPGFFAKACVRASSLCDCAPGAFRAF